MKISSYTRVILLIALFSSPVFGQISNEFMTGATKGLVDTLGYETTKTLTKEVIGLLERPIDPDKYVLGPNDELTISIVSSKSLQFKVMVTPEGKLPIPYVGIVNVKDKTLSESEKIIIEKVKKVINTDDVAVTLSEIRKFKVTVSGAVRKPNTVPATPVDRVSEAIEKAGGLKYNASVRKILLYRYGLDHPIKVDLVGFNLRIDDSDNPFLMGGDHIVVPVVDDDNFIEIFGEVSSKGKFEFVEGDSLSTLIGFALGFNDLALLDSVELARVENRTMVTKRILDLTSWKGKYNSTEGLPNNIPLESGDRVFVRKISDAPITETVVILGEVTYPGYYASTRGQTKVLDLIKQAGGFTKDALIESTTLIRQKEYLNQDDEMDRLHRTPASEMSENERRYFQARVREKKGVMAIDFKKIIKNPESADNVYLENLDSIYVPQKKIFVNVQGRVNKPGLVIFDPTFTYLDYIQAAGGYGFRADENETIIAKTKGEQFLAESLNYTIEPGDNILVPPESEVSFWETFMDALTVIVQIASVVGVIVSMVILTRSN